MHYIFAFWFCSYRVLFFSQTFLELNRLNHCERWENIPSVCPPRSCRALLSLSHFVPCWVWSSEFGPICIWNAFYSYANKRIRFTGHSSCSHQVAISLAPAILIFNTFQSPRRQWERKRRKGREPVPPAPLLLLSGLNGEGLLLWQRFSPRDLHQPRIHSTRSLGLTWNGIICIQWCAGPSTIETILANAIHCKLL